MRNRRKRERSGRSRPIRHPLHKPSDNLASLLDDERFLLLVFEHLVDYGLQECSLVCRKWREVSMQFPVELTVKDAEQIQKIANFSNTTSLTADYHFPTMSNAELFGHFASLNNLKSLVFGPGYISLDKSAQHRIQSMTKLTELRIEHSILDPSIDALTSIKCLTNLTKLVLLCGSRKLGLDPIVELENIQELDVYAHDFFDHQGSCMFPSLTNLTSLKLSDDLVEFEPPVQSAQDISLFAGSLQHVSLRLREHWGAVDCTPFTSLTSLRILDFGRMHCSQNFVPLLPQLQSLTRLCTRDFWLGVGTALAESMARCLPLKAYHCSKTSVNKHDLRCASKIFKLTQLTELAIPFRWSFLEDLCCMTLLECLHLNVEFDYDCSLDQALSCLLNLQTLEISFEDTDFRHGENVAGTMRLSGDVFSDMDKLSSVSLQRVDITESFFRELATKTGLTRLEFTSSEHRHYSRNFISQVNLLRNLEVLTLQLLEEFKLCSLLSPTGLWKLRRLNVSGDKGNVEAVRKNFDESIHPALVNRKESPWRSRLPT